MVGGQAGRLANHPSNVSCLPLSDGHVQLIDLTPPWNVLDTPWSDLGNPLNVLRIFFMNLTSSRLSYCVFAISSFLISYSPSNVYEVLRGAGSLLI